MDYGFGFSPCNPISISPKMICHTYHINMQLYCCFIPNIICLMFYIYLKLYNLIFYIYISARNYWLQLIIIMPLQSPHLTLSLYDYDIVLTIFVVFFSWELPTLITSIVTKCSSFQKSFSNVQIYN